MTPAETPTWEDAAVETQKTLNLALRRITELEHLLASHDARIRELVAKVEQRETELTAIYDWIQMNRERQFTETRAISAAHNPTALARSSEVPK